MKPRTSVKAEQLAIVLRYVGVQTAAIYERYVPAESLTAESLAMKIWTTLRNYQLDPKYIVSDGASVMSVLEFKHEFVKLHLRQSL